jgi:hypothetical protein
VRLTRQQLEEMERQGRGIDTSRYQEGIDTSQHLIWMQPTIAARILDAVERAGQKITRKQIADALGLHKTPWLVSAIERLAAEGYLVRYEGRTPQGMIVWLYERNPDRE